MTNVPIVRPTEPVLNLNQQGLDYVVGPIQRQDFTPGKQVVRETYDLILKNHRVVWSPTKIFGTYQVCFGENIDRVPPGNVRLPWRPLLVVDTVFCSKYVGKRNSTLSRVIQAHVTRNYHIFFLPVRTRIIGNDVVDCKIFVHPF